MDFGIFVGKRRFLEQIPRGYWGMLELLGKQSHVCSLSIPSYYIRMELGPGTLPYKEIKSLNSLCWICQLGNIFPVWDLMCVPLLCLSMCVLWHLVSPHYYICPLQGGGEVPMLQHKRDTCSSIAFHQNCWKGLTGYEWLTPTPEADLALFFFFTFNSRKVSFHLLLR
jgi:hypothetical protein